MGTLIHSQLHLHPINLDIHPTPSSYINVPNEPVQSRGLGGDVDLGLQSRNDAISRCSSHLLFNDVRTHVEEQGLFTPPVFNNQDARRSEEIVSSVFRPIRFPHRVPKTRIHSRMKYLRVGLYITKYRSAKVSQPGASQAGSPCYGCSCKGRRYARASRRRCRACYHFK